MKCFRIQVFGKVQGVWFRASAKKQAVKCALQGTVRNLEDGSVLIMVQGLEKDLESFIAWCKQGPEFSKVLELQIDEVEIQSFDSFQIVRA